jgi:hypothetical protein
MNRLWTDQYLMNVFAPKNPDNVAIESIVHGERNHVFGATSLNNETPIAELQYDVSCFFRTMWWPTITDDFNTLDVKTGIKIGDTQAEMDQRQQLHVQYDMTQSPPAQNPSPQGEETFELNTEKKEDDDNGQGSD